MTLKGGLLPVVTFLGPAFAGLISGSFIIESIFFIPGLGRFFVTAAFNRDYTMVLGTVLFYASSNHNSKSCGRYYPGQP